MLLRCPRLLGALIGLAIGMVSSILAVTTTRTIITIRNEDLRYEVSALRP